MRLRDVLAAALVLGSFGAAQAEPTEIVVRVLSKDAKFIGTETGGVQVTLRDADTDEVLSQGMTAGTTGNTAKIMSNGRARRDTLSDEGSAKYSAILDIQRPRRVTATITDPRLSKDAAIIVSSTQWILPGKSVGGGDGWVLEYPGFAITSLERLPEMIELRGGKANIPLKVKITMQCGCPITPGGMWDANKIQVSVMLEDSAKAFPAVPLRYAGQPSTFAGELAVAAPGRYTIDVYAYDPSNGNTGLAKFPLTVR
jgi:hypothetical protein